MVPPAPGSIEMNNINEESFPAFLDGWLVRQEQYFGELVDSIECNNNAGGSNDEGNIEGNEVRQKQLVDRVIAHYIEYYRAKARVADENVFVLFSPTWFSSFERSYLWIAGFRPGLAFRLASSSVTDLTEDQTTRLNSLREEIEEDENELSDALAAVQTSMVAPPMLALAMQMGRVRNGAVTDLDSAIDRLRASMETLVGCADYLRGKTVAKIMEILTSGQAMMFLAAAAHFQLQIRRYGLTRDAQSQRSNE